MTQANLVFEQHIPISQPNLTAIECLALECQSISKQKLKFAMMAGAVWLTQNNKTIRIRRAKRILNVGEELHLYYNEKLLLADIEPAELVADSISYSIWNKPSGMFSQGTKWGDRSAICRWVEQVGFPGRQAFLVHRLDRATSGLIIVSHANKVTAQLAKLFENRQIVKRYRAVVTGEFIFEAEAMPIKIEIDGKPALTHILQSQYHPSKKRSLLTLEIETGRKHQIRKHLAELGFPIVGDRMYGAVSPGETVINEKIPDLQLQCYYLRFECPIKGEINEFTLASSLIL